MIKPFRRNPEGYEIQPIESGVTLPEKITVLVDGFGALFPPSELVAKVDESENAKIDIETVANEVRQAEQIAIDNLLAKINATGNF